MRTLLTGAGGVWTWKVALQHVTLFTVFIFLWHRMYDASRQTPWDRYGSLGTCALLFLKTLPLLSLPFTVFNFLGIFLFPLKLPRINCQSSVKGKLTFLLTTYSAEKVKKHHNLDPGDLFVTIPSTHNFQDFTVLMTQAWSGGGGVTPIGQNISKCENFDPFFH